MTPNLERALGGEQEMWITTFDADGNPGSVPVWFVWHKGIVWTSTGSDSAKARRLRGNPQVVLAFGTRKGLAAEGKAQFVTAATTARELCKLFNAKYDGYYGAAAAFGRAVVTGETALLRITLRNG